LSEAETGPDPASGGRRRFRRAAEIAATVAAAVLMVDRMAAQTHTAHWLHWRVYQFLRAIGLDPRRKRRRLNRASIQEGSQEQSTGSQELINRA